MITTTKKVAKRLNNLKDYCYFAKDSDFIEITECPNGEGFDIDICTERDNRRIFLTYGEFDAIKILALWNGGNKQ